MKYTITTFFIVSLMMQSCSHIVCYEESIYESVDSPYPATSMMFSYYANGRSIPTNLANAGERIYNKIVIDTCYKNYLQSAVKYENQKGEDKDKRRGYETVIEKASNIISSPNGEHKYIVNP